MGDVQMGRNSAETKFLINGFSRLGRDTWWIFEKFSAVPDCPCDLFARVGLNARPLGELGLS